MSDGERPRRVILPLLAGLVAILLLYLALPRVRASLLYLPVDSAIDRYFATRRIPGAQLEALRRRARETLSMHDHYRYWEGLSVVLYLRALDDETPGFLRRPALWQSRQAASEVVRRAPANPATWLRIARLSAALGLPGRDVAGPLKMSVLSGRVEPALLVPRLELGYRYLERLDQETRALLRDQTVLGWRISTAAFLAALRDGRISFTRVRALLGESDVGILEEMETRIDPTV